MPRQSQGAEGVDESQPSNAPSGSSRLDLKDVSAWISAVNAVTERDKAVNQSTAAKQRKVAVDMDEMMSW